MPTLWVNPLHARFHVCAGAWLCRSSLQGATLRRRRFAPGTRTAAPSDVFNRGIKVERYIGTLFFDSRWDRKGWPAEAWAELQFLHALHRTAYAEQYPQRYETEDELKWL